MPQVFYYPSMTVDKFFLRINNLFYHVVGATRLIYQFFLFKICYRNWKKV